MTEQKTDLLLAGLDDYLSKPISENQLLHILKRWLSGQAQSSLLNSKPNNQDSQKINPHASSEATQDVFAAPVDITLSLQLSNHKADLARDMLAMLLKDLPDQSGAIRQAQADNDLEAMEIVVHKIRGGASYCGVRKLKASSSEVDELLRKRSYNESVINNLLADIDELVQWSESVDLDVLFELETVNSAS
jgi:two-component system sensor histidine kinase BarA